MELWAKDLYDGTKAVAVFNRGQKDADFTIQFSDLNLVGQQNVWNIWDRKDVGVFTDSLHVSVRLHDVEFLQFGSENSFISVAPRKP